MNIHKTTHLDSKFLYVVGIHDEHNKSKMERGLLPGICSNFWFLEIKEKMEDI